MTTTITDVATIPTLGHDEAMVLAEAEFARTLDLLQQLGAEEWRRPTVCRQWDVRAMVAHVVGMAEAQASFRQFAHDYRAASKRSGGPMIDAMTAAQVRDRTSLTPTQLVERLAEVAPRAVRARRRSPAVLRWAVRMKQDPPFDTERWKFGYLVDTIFTRDTWMHRLDLCRATGRTMVLTADHDGRLVADVVVEWARRHGQPFSLALSGAAGGRWATEDGGGEDIQMDALDFCWTLAGRAPGTGLLETPVPF
ncbi:MAG TPA: maleylpyruvate isomerase family mycothiol-dependent enzyme [Acidimicrobiales bacterium]|nr:maleylpyruvate isomerase family mycothiol-dependent enzyme [Acidimicrobiales bacterium]